jgi:diguanylate cyclase (GGDEF)-like protein
MHHARQQSFTMPAAVSARLAAPAAIPALAAPSSDFAPLLEAIRQRLDIAFAAIHLFDGAALRLECTVGAQPAVPCQTALCREVFAATLAVIVPDTDLDRRFVHAAVPFRFFAGIPLTVAAGRTVGVLSLFDMQPRSALAAHRLADLAAEVMGLAPPPAQTISQLQAQLESQARLIREQADVLAHRNKVFERAAATARIGVWECDLRTEALTWTDGVYDIFEIPRGTAVTRELTLNCYSDASRRQLDQLRSQAVERGIGFTLDAEIITLNGKKRWMRLTTSAETENGVTTRIFGMKQDITEEKILADRTRYLAEFDVMTGLANRSLFQSRLAELDSVGAIGALLLVDLDGFKAINDNHGHALGDECLKETAQRLAAVCEQAELVARIGGDEFAVILGQHVDALASEALAARIVAILADPVVRVGQSLKIGASVGIARGDGANPADLFKQADAALYAAKAAGRNTFRVFTPT